MNTENDQNNQQLKFVYLQQNKQRVWHLVINFKRFSILAFVCSIFFAIFQIEKHIAIYLEHEQSPNPFIKEHQFTIYSFNLHTIYAFLTLLCSLLVLYKAWQIKKTAYFDGYDLECFRIEFYKIQDFIYLNLLIALFCMIRFFEAGFLHIWLDIISSVVGISIGKYLQKYRSEILLYSTQLKQESA